MTTRPCAPLSGALTPAPAAAGTPAPADAALPLATDARARIAHLFRAARRQGRIHPLQHLIERYRAPQAAADDSARQP